MAKTRKALSINIRKLVLHEAGYKCANPVCRGILTLDIHHMIPISKKGEGTVDNLLALCPNCHALHHQGHISEDSIRTWKMLLLALNEAFDRHSIDLLLTIEKSKIFWISGDGVLRCSSLIASDLVESRAYSDSVSSNRQIYRIALSQKGRLFIDAWKNGNQKDAISRIK